MEHLEHARLFALGINSRLLRFPADPTRLAFGQPPSRQRGRDQAWGCGAKRFHADIASANEAIHLGRKQESWMASSLSLLAMTADSYTLPGPHTPPHSRGANPPERCKIVAPENKPRARGMPGARCTRSLAWEKIEPHERSHREVHREHPAFPHAMVFTVYAALSPVIGLGCHRRLRIGVPGPVGPTRLRRLDASVEASGPHDFAVRTCAVRRSRLGIAHGRPALQSPCAPALPRPPRPAPRS